jgi:signal transduction histidine kinase
MKKLFLIIYFFLLLTIPSLSQEDKIYSLKKVRDSLSSDTGRILVSIELIEALWRNDNDAEAMKEAETAYSLSQNIPYDIGTGMALMHIGIINYRKSYFRGSLTSLLEAIPYFEKVGRKSDLALVFHWTGNSYYKLSQFEKSLEYYLKSLRLREEIGDEQGTAFSYYNIANIYFDQKQYETALDYHFKSLAIKGKLNDSRGIAFSFNNIANNYMELQEVDKALDYYQQAYVLFREINHQQGIAYTLGNIARIYKKNKQFSKALESLLQAKAIMEEINDKQALIEAHNQIASVMISLRQYSSSEKHLLYGQLLARETGSEEALIDNYLEFSRLDSARNNMKGAFEWHKKYVAKKESIFDTQKSKQIAEMQAAFDLERKDQEIVLLNKETELHRSQRKNQLVIFACVLLTMFAVMSGLMYFLRQKQKTNRKLEEQKKYSEELNRLNDKLFSIISHDLRNPLISLKSILELAANQRITKEELTVLLSSIGDNTQHVMDLLDNLLNWAREHLSGDPVAFENMNLNEIVQNAINLLKPMADQKNIRLVDQLSNSAIIYGNRNMIELVVRNLLSNAIKFTQSMGEVIINCELNASYVTISIRDTGIGIPHDQLSKLFGTKNFSTRGTANEKGSGLGLILCREFVEKNGGTIWVRSTEKKGSSFYFTLPMAQALPAVITA